MLSSIGALKLRENISHIPGGFSNQGLVDSVISILSKNCPSLVTIDLSNNDITSLMPWRKLGNVCTQLQNVSLEYNNIRVNRLCCPLSMT